MCIIDSIWWAATRVEFMDTGGYITAYRTMPSSLGEMGAFFETVNKDKGFFALGVLIKSIVGDTYVYYLSLIHIFLSLSRRWWRTNGYRKRSGM